MPADGEGFETVAFSPRNTHISGQDDSQYDARLAAEGPVTDDPDFSLLANAWPALSPADRKTILAIIRAASVKGEP